jgi:hypothetical protein
MNQRIGSWLAVAAVLATAATASARPADKLDPQTLITAQEAAALLGAPVTLQVHDMQAIYPGSADFAYQTKNIRILSAVFYPTGGAEMFESQRKTLSGMGKKLTPCSAGDACFLVGEQLNARRKNVYFTLEAGRDNVNRVEALANKVVGRLP